jgi:hypothetical protein
MRNWYRTLTREVLRGWEPERMLYSLLLASVVLGDVWYYWPALKDVFVIKQDALFHVLRMAALVNYAFCTAYLADVLVQVVRQRATRVEWRCLVLAIRFVTAAGFAHIAMSALFTAPPHPVQ